MCFLKYKMSEFHSIARVAMRLRRIFQHAQNMRFMRMMCIRIPHVSAWPTLTATSDQSVNMLEAELICKELRRVIIVACLVFSGGQLTSFLDTTQRAFSKHQTIFLFGRKAKCLCDLVLFTLWQNLEQICLESISQIHPCAAPWLLKLSRKITEAGKRQTTF